MNKAKIVLVGLGRMGRNHLRVIRENPSFELVAVVDKDAAAPDIGAARFCRSIDEVRDLDFECVAIATPTASHFDVAKQFIAMGKHLLVEKPITSTSAQGRELIGLARQKNLKMAVGHVERFNPAVRKLREVIKGGFLGAPIHFSVTRVGGYPDTLLSGNNVLLDLAVHDIDVLRSIIGPLKLESSVSHSTVKEGVLDTAEILLTGAGSVSATIHVNWITPTKIRSIRVTGSRGVCFVDYILQTCELLGGSSLYHMQPSNTGFENLRDLYKTTDRIQFGVQKEEPLRVQLSQFYDLLRKDEAGELCLGRDALSAVILAERAMRAEADRSKEPQKVDQNKLPDDSDLWV